MATNNEMTLEQVLALIKRKIDEVGSQKAAAERWGVSEAYISQVLSGTQNPGRKILDAINVEHVDKYRFKKKRNGG